MKASTSSPWLSVIIPVFQGEAYLDAALGSIAAQDRTDDLEIIAVDDGSTDGSRAILERWSKVLPINLISQPHEGNWVRSTNRALEQATGTWVSLLHQDDGWLPGRLQTLREQSAVHPDVDFWLHPAYFIDAAGKRVGRWRCPFPPRQPLRAAQVLPRLLLQNTIPIVSPLVRRSSILAVGPLDESLWYFADWDFWLRLAANGTIFYWPEPLAGYRIHPQSQTTRRTGDLEAVGRQFDVTVNRALDSAAFPASQRARSLRTLPFARAMYLFLLAGLHGGGVPARALWRTAFRAGPLGWIRYWRYSRLPDRLWPRLKLYFQSRRRGER